MVVDAEQVRIQAVNKYVGDTVLRQLAQADLILLNKTDLVSPKELASLRAWLTEQAPATPMIETVRSQVPLDVLLGARGHRPPESARLQDTQPLDHSDADRTWTLERTDPPAREDLERFASGFGEHLYRAKGFVHLREDPARRCLYQQIGARWALEAGSAWGEDTARTLVVLIGAAHAAGTEALDVLEPSMA